FPVVVEVREDLDVTAPLLEAPSPLLQLALAVVAPSSARAIVESHERPVRRELVRLELLHLRTVADHERGAVRPEQVVDRLDEPACVPELEAMAAGRKRLERSRQAFVVALEGRRELPEHGPELRRAYEWLDALVVARHPTAQIREPLDVRQVAARLDREEEVRWRLSDPAGDRRLQ